MWDYTHAHAYKHTQARKQRAHKNGQRCEHILISVRDACIWGVFVVRPFVLVIRPMLSIGLGRGNNSLGNNEYATDSVVTPIVGGCDNEVFHGPICSAALGGISQIALSCFYSPADHRT